MCVYDMFLELGQPCLSICARVKGEAPTSDEAKNCSRFHKITPVSRFFSAQSWGVDLSFHAGLRGLQTATLPSLANELKGSIPPLLGKISNLGWTSHSMQGPLGSRRLPSPSSLASCTVSSLRHRAECSLLPCFTRQGGGVCGLPARCRPSCDWLRL